MELPDDLLQAAQREGIEAATGIDLPTDMALLAVTLGVIDKTTYQTMRVCHEAYTEAKKAVGARRVRAKHVAALTRKMNELGRQDGRAGQEPRTDLALASHFTLRDDCTLNELAAYHSAYLTAYGTEARSVESASATA